MSLPPAAFLRCLDGIVRREALRFLNQRGRFLSALVRPLAWLIIFASGFRFTFGVSIIPPCETYVLYEDYVVPGLAAMVLLFQAMQSSLPMVHEREMGSMRVLLTSLLPRWWLLTCKLVAGTLVGVAQAYVFLLIAWLWEVQPPPFGFLAVLPALLLPALMLAGLMLGRSASCSRRESASSRTSPAS